MKEKKNIEKAICQQYNSLVVVIVAEEDYSYYNKSRMELPGLSLQIFSLSFISRLLLIFSDSISVVGGDGGGGL